MRPRRLTIEVYLLSIDVPADLPDAGAEAVRRAVGGRRFRRAVVRTARRRLAVSGVSVATVTLTR